MKSKMRKLAWIAATIVLLQPAVLLAVEDPCRGIGGTGRAAECGIGGTGNSSNAGIGGTGHSGIGGTGAAANRAGIGGTGHTQGDGGIGGTGIVGIITGFGSIWVNGLEVQYDTKTQVTGNDSDAGSKELAIGQVVVVEAQGSDAQLQANKISVVNAVSGRVSALNDKEGKLTVLGQTVSITTQTILQDRQNPQNALHFSESDYVKVSGLRLANGEIVASRIERTAPATESTLAGPITAINGNVIEVYGLKISTTGANALSVGQEITATGTMNGAVLAAHDVTPNPATQLYGRAEHINLQGYVSAMSADGQIKVGNMEVVVTGSSIASKDKQNILTSGELVRVSGHFANEHTVIADRIEIDRDRIERVQLDSLGGNARVDAATRIEHRDHADHADRSDHLDRPDRPDHTEHSDAAKQSEHSHK